MGLLTKRLQQGVWEALASQNRMAGSGGGTGLRPGFIAGLTTSAGFVTGITNAAWKTIASVTVQGRPHLVDAILFANFTWQRTAGVIADTFYAEIEETATPTGQLPSD